MNIPTLRHQLAERKTPPSTNPAAPGSDTPASARCFAVSGNAAGVKFAGDKKTFSFPYSHYLFSELVSDDTLAIRFATHRVFVFGQKLEFLLDELTSQSLAVVRVLPKRQRDQALPGGVWIDRIDVKEVGHAKPEACSASPSTE